MEKWQKLFSIAMSHINACRLPKDSWRLGGGTALMNYWRHRFSKDIDIFVSDAQLLNYFSPRMNGTLGDSDYDEQMNFIKVWLPDGEIDFILARNSTNLPPNIVEISGNKILVDHPGEIVAKKIEYRIESFTLRDVFDLACMLEFEDDAEKILKNSMSMS